MSFFATLGLLTGPAEAGNFSLVWGTAPYTWTAGSIGPNTFTLTDQYGFQVQVRLSISQTNGVTVSGYPDDIIGFGTQRSIGIAWDPPISGSLIGGSPNVATMEILSGGTAFGVNGLTFRVSDIDAVDNNRNPPTSDRCDHITATGNAGNPTLAAVTGSPTFLLGPGAGAGASPALASNQAQCNFQTSTTVTSGSSTGDDNGSLVLTFPDDTHTATVTYNESIRNVFSSTTANAAARGVGVWSATAFTVDNTISLDKQTTASDFTSVGDVITYTFTITNNGPLPILSSQDIQIQDSKIGTFTCGTIPVSGISSGGTHSCTANYTVSAADVAAGFVTNDAVAGLGTGTMAFASRLQSNTDSVTVPRRPLLTLEKTVTNDNGGTQAVADWTLSATGPTDISGVTGASAVTSAPVMPGIYTLAESGPAGYSAGSWSCTAGSLSGNSLTLAYGETATCAINNDDIAPVLTLVKTITGDTTPSAVPSFTLTATGTTTISGATGDAAVTNAAVSAGTYTLSESSHVGYIAGSWSCTAGSLSGSSLTLTPGTTATCTINNVRRPTVAFQKVTLGAFGGPFSFTSGGNLASVPGNITTTAIGTPAPASPTPILATAIGADTSIVETPATGYELTDFTCTDSNSASSGNPASGIGSFTGNTGTIPAANVVAGAILNCVLTNSRLPTVTVQKTTTGGFGGPFTFTDDTITGTFAAITTTSAGTATPAFPATHTATLGVSATITESSDVTWVAGSVTCTDSNSGVTGNSNPVATGTAGAVTIPAAANVAGATINCVFTNAAAAPTLTIDKSWSFADPGDDADGDGLADVGDIITYSYLVTNTGNVTITGVSVNDTHNGYGTLGAITPASVPSLAPSASATFTASYSVVQGDIDNP